MRVTASGLALLATISAAAHAQTTTASATPQALTLAEILDLKKNGVATAQILQSAREYCLAFVVADSAERELRTAGADSTLIEGLRTVCRAPSVGLASAPTVVYAIDDDFRTNTGILPTSAAGSAACRSRYDVDGFSLTSASAQLGCTVGYPSGALEGDIRIEVDVAVISGSSTIVALGFGRDRTSWDRWSFNVQSNGRYELCRFSGPRCVKLVSLSSASPAWRKGMRAENRLVVEVEGRLLKLFINDEKVAEADAGADPAGHIVLGVGPSGGVSWRRLRVAKIGG